MIREKLNQDSLLLKKQLMWLELSYKESGAIGIKESYSIEEFGKFETLCSRYSRGVDFLVRKIFRTLDDFEFENQGTLVDVVNSAHKRGLIDSVEQMRIMKDVRNSIAHEYIEDELETLFEEVLEHSGALIVIINRTLEYMVKISK